MKNTLKKTMIELIVISFLLSLLLLSDRTMELASKGLLIWYRNMIPSLFPFMVFSGFLVRSGLANRFSNLLRPILGILFPSSGSMLYAIFMGFLCGFPMGARVVADLVENGQITVKQGQYLLSFCNNIGPLYMLGYVLPLFGWENTAPIFLILYGVPLGYGFLLQFFPGYRKELRTKKDTEYRLVCCEYPSTAAKHIYGRKNTGSTGYLTSFQAALENALGQITLLGGCMAFFNCLQIYPELIGQFIPIALQGFYQRYLYAPLCCLLEIGGGLDTLASTYGNYLSSPSLYESGLIIAFLTFGGLSCIMQTLFMIKNTRLSLQNYLTHKLLQAFLAFLLSSLLVFI